MCHPGPCKDCPSRAGIHPGTEGWGREGESYVTLLFSITGQHCKRPGGGARGLPGLEVGKVRGVGVGG